MKIKVYPIHVGGDKWDLRTGPTMQDELLFWGNDYQVTEWFEDRKETHKEVAQ